MARGSKPGERRGGRQKGTKNRRTLERERLAAQAAAAGAAGLDPAQVPTAQKLGKQVIQDVMNLYLGLAAQRQRLPGWQQDAAFFEHLDKAAQWATELAPYESAKIQTLRVGGDPTGVPIKNETTTKPAAPAGPPPDLSKMTLDELTGMYRETVAAGGRTRH